MPKSLEEHAENWDLRHEDFKNNDFLYQVYSVMRQKAPFAHTDTPFLSATPGGAWVATRYEECYKILQDWQHFSSNPTPDGARQLAGDLVVTLDPPQQQSGSGRHYAAVRDGGHAIGVAGTRVRPPLDGRVHKAAQWAVSPLTHAGASAHS